VDELVSRGIDAERFLYSGMGGLEPVGDNATDEGRMQNRRVEILILED
jgi:flagellar motor protein MotB